MIVCFCLLTKSEHHIKDWFYSEVNSQYLEMFILLSSLLVQYFVFGDIFKQYFCYTLGLNCVMSTASSSRTNKLLNIRNTNVVVRCPLSDLD